MIVQLYQLKETRTYCPECRRDISRLVHKGVDVGLATHILRLAYRDVYYALILSSGHGDLKGSVHHVCETLGKNVSLCVFRAGVSGDLQMYANNMYWIDDFADEVAK